MAIDQKTMLQTVYDTIFDALTTTPRGLGTGRPILPRTTTYMSLSIPGNPVDVTQFANAWSPTNPNGSTLASENLATLVDPVPVFIPAYAASGGSTDDLYGEIVRANVAPPPPDPVGQAAFDRAFNLLNADGTDFDEEGRPITVKVPSPLYRNYQNRLSAYNAALLSYLTNFNQYDLSNPADARKWSILAPVLQAPVDQAFNDLQTARPGVVETAIATLGQYQQSSLAGIFTRARQLYDQTRRGSVLQPGFFWHLCEAFPGNWFADSAAANFSQVTLNSSRVRISEDSRFSSYGAGGGVNFGLWRVGASGSHQSQQSDMSQQTSNMNISFRFGRIEIRRRWLNSALFSLRGWSTAGRSPGDYSNGRDTNNPGVFALLPTAFIVARDIKISANWGQTDLHTASQSTSVRASVGWGPFSLSGNYSNSSSTKRFSSSFDGTTITVPGIQIIAWLSTIAPFCPPTGGPPAAPVARRDLAVLEQRRNAYAARYAMVSAGSGDDNGFEGVLSSDGRSRIPSQPALAPADEPQGTFVNAEEEQLNEYSVSSSDAEQTEEALVSETS